MSGFSRDPKTQHDGNPTACNDTDAEYYVQVVKKATDGTQSDAAADTAQLRAILGSTVAPSSYFSMSVPNNSLIALVDSITTAHEQWQIVVDDDTAPTIGDGSWTPGSFGGPYILPDWDVHTYYAWINDGTTVSAVPTKDGTGSITMRAKDLEAPVDATTGGDWGASAANFWIEKGDNPTTDIKLHIIAPVDTGAGLKQIDLYVVVGSSATLLLSDVSDLQNVSNFPVGSKPTLRLVASDLAVPANLTSSVDATVQLDSVGATGAGTIRLSSNYYEENDDATPQALVATLTPKLPDGVTNTRDTDSPYIQVKVSTVNRLTECIGGVPYAFNTADTGSGGDVDSAADTITITGHPWSTQDPVTPSWDGGVVNIGLVDARTVYVNVVDADTIKLYDTPANALAGTGTGLKDLTGSGSETQYLFDGAAVAYEKKDGEVVSWAAGPGGDTGDKTVSIKLTKRAANYNNMFELQIDYNSNTESDGSTPIGAIGTLNAALCKILSSSTGADGFIPDANGMIVFDVNNANNERVNSTVTGQTADQWLPNSDINGKNGDSMSADLNSHTYGSLAARYAGAGAAPQINANIITPGGVNYTAWARAWRGVWGQDGWHLDVDNSDSADLLGYYSEPYDAGDQLPVLGAPGFAWTKTNYSADRVTGVLSAGQHTINIEPLGSEIIDAVCLIPTTSSQVPTDFGSPIDANNESVGPDESTYSVGSSASDNPNNPTSPGIPGPDASVSPSTLTPSNGSLTAALSGQVVSADFSSPVITQLVITEFSIYSGSALVSMSSISTGASSVSRTILSTLQPGATITVVLRGSGRNTSNQLVTFDTTGSWSFNAINSGSSDILLNVNFEDQDYGPWSQAAAEAVGQYNMIGYADVYPDDTWIEWNTDVISIVDDPLGTHGKVCKFFRNAGHEIPDYTASMRWDFGSGGVHNPSEDEVYFSQDIMFPAGFTQARIVKHLNLFSGTQRDSTHNYGQIPSPEGLYGMVNLIQSFNDTAWQNGNSVDLYCYDAEKTQWTEYFLNTNHTYEPTNDAYVYQFPQNVWVRYEIYVKMNSAFKIDNIVDLGGGVVRITTNTPHNFAADGEKCMIWGVGGDGSSNENSVLAFAKWLDELWVQDPDIASYRTVTVTGEDSTHLLVGISGSLSGTLDFSDAWISRFDGISRVWVTDPSQWSGARLCHENTSRIWRWKTGTMGPDGIGFNQYYGGDPNNPLNYPAEDQYYLYDNIIVSRTRITG